MVILGGQSSVFLALPDMTRSLSASPTAAQWVLDAYVVALAALLLPAGALGDRFGRRRLLLVGLTIFAVASACLALSETTSTAIASRLVMGAGAACVFPATLATITATLPAEERRRGITLWTTTTVLSGFGGLLLSAFVLEVLSWRAIVWVFAIAAILVLLASRFFIAESAAPERAPTDALGLTMAVAGMALLVGGIIESPSHGIASPEIIAALALGVIGLVGFVLWELRTRLPLLNLRAIATPSSTAAAIALLAYYLGCYASITVAVPYFVTMHGLSPLQSGIAILGYAPLLLPFAWLYTRVAHRIDRRHAIVLGLFGFVVGNGFLALISADSGLWMWLVGAGLCGAGLGVGQAAATEALVSALPAAEQGIASAINDITRELGAALGIAIGGAVLTAATGHSGNVAADFIHGWRATCLAQALIPLAAAVVVAAVHGGRVKELADTYRQP
jgi:MFS family permease